MCLSLRWSLFVVLFVWLNIVVSGQIRRERNSHFIVEDGQDVPRFDFVLLEGDSLDSDYLLGKVCVIQFAASWCPFSQAQLVALDRRVWRKHADNVNFAMLGICEDLPADQAEFLRQREEREISIPFCIDHNERIYRLFVTPNGSVTRTVIVDSAGTIVQLHDAHTRRDFRQIRKCVSWMLRHGGHAPL